MIDPVTGPAHAIASIPWIDGPCQFIFRAVYLEPRRRLIFARPLESSDEGNWLVCSADRRRGRLNDKDARKAAEKAAQALSQETGEFTLSRFFVVPFEGIKEPGLFKEWGCYGPNSEATRELREARAVLDAHGLGAWIHNHNAPFYLDIDFDFENQGRHAYEELTNQLLQPDSDTSFAFMWGNLEDPRDVDEHLCFEWAYLGHNPKLAILCGGHKKLYEIYDVMRLIMWCERNLWAKGNDWQWNINYNQENWRLRGDFDFYSFDEIQKEFPLMFCAGVFLTQVVLQNLWAPLWGRHCCTRDDYNSWMFMDVDSIDAPSTAHERLEAFMHLRSWLEKNATPEEFAELWSQLKSY